MNIYGFRNGFGVATEWNYISVKWLLLYTIWIDQLTLVSLDTVYKIILVEQEYIFKNITSAVLILVRLYEFLHQVSLSPIAIYFNINLLFF